MICDLFVVDSVLC